MTADLDTCVKTAPNDWVRPTLALAGADHLGSGGAEKLAARVAQRIEQDIVRSGWQVGQVLGSETQLRERYQVSRAVLREAIRLVEHHQVAEMRRGPAGGLTVRAPDAGATASAMVMYLESVGITLDHLLAVRLILEPVAVALAAERITEAGIAQLREVVSGESRTSDNDANARNQLHLTLAAQSGNPALALFVDVLLRLTWRYAGPQMANLPSSDHPAIAEAREAHQAIVSAVVAGRSSQAQFLATQHLEALTKYLQGWQPTGNDAGKPTRVESATSPTPDPKLAEVVAQRILAEIVEGGWEVGSVIGSEPVLLDRFEVSRAVLREAVRLLEYHSVARMRRGPGGGLVVTKPSPTASIDAIALYLDYQGIGTEELWTVRGALELGCVEQVAERADQQQVADRLRAYQHAAIDFPTGRRGHCCHPLHVELAELSGNPALALFLRIITTLETRQVHTPLEDTFPSPNSSPESQHDGDTEHQAILTALLTGDAGLARHRMRNHLRLTPNLWP